MDQRAEYLIRILENIGSPLMSAIIEAGGDKPVTEETSGLDAQKIAELLAKTVQTSIDLGNLTELSSAEMQNDSLRVALAALASPLVADLYKNTGQAPSDNDIKRITTALQAVMTFAENFSPSPDNAERLKTLQAKGAGLDEHQITVQYIQALIPAVNAIAAFPFGQSEQKLVTDVSSRLSAKASSIREVILSSSGDEMDKKLINVAILKALAQLYATCHRAETDRITKLSEEERGNLSLDPVWNAFDIRAAMLEALVKNLLPGTAAASSTGTGDTKAPAPPEAPPPQAPPQQVTPIETVPPEGTPQEGNPMAMFAKKDEGGEEKLPEKAPPPPPPQETSPAEPKEEPPSDSPMAFFKQSPKKDDE